jgi:hypothetical protein
VDWLEAARFFSRAVFEEAGGYDEENTGTEDYDLPQRIEAAYGRQVIGRISRYIMHNEQQIRLLESCKKKFYYAQKLDKYKSSLANQGRYNLQSNPLARYKLFFNSPKRLYAQPVLGMGMVFMKTLEFGFGAAGYLVAKR